MESSLVESYGALRQYPNKGHDRLIMDEKNVFFGALDGAGDELLSGSINRNFSNIYAHNSHIRTISQPSFLASVLTDMDAIKCEPTSKTAGAFACIKETDENVEVSFANAGDSSIFFLNKSDKRIVQLAHDPTSHVVRDERLYVNTLKFLGRSRPKAYFEKIIGNLLLPKADEWTLVGFSDGVKDDDGKGIKATQLQEILRYCNPSHATEQILDSFKQYDDQSIFLISR